MRGKLPRIRLIKDLLRIEEQTTMKENKISIQIPKSVDEVFEFTINPANTPRWIQHLDVEETNEWPAKLGTIYRNRGASGAWSEYVVSVFELNKTFELVAKDKNYHVRYTYTELESGDTELEYFEWVDRGELEEPFTQKILEKLKSVMENK